MYGNGAAIGIMILIIKLPLRKTHKDRQKVLTLMILLLLRESCVEEVFYVTTVIAAVTGWPDV
jgi:hypothetical protein